MASNNPFIGHGPSRLSWRYAIRSRQDSDMTTLEPGFDPPEGSKYSR
jgi:hypothetical protein